MEHSCRMGNYYGTLSGRRTDSCQGPHCLEKIEPPSRTSGHATSIQMHLIRYFFLMEGSIGGLFMHVKESYELKNRGGRRVGKGKLSDVCHLDNLKNL